MDRFDKAFLTAWSLLAIGAATFWIAAIIIAVHFLTKVW